MQRARTADLWREADELFAAAMEVAPETRDELLRLECTGRPDLRREVEALLRADTVVDAWIERSEAIIRRTVHDAFSGGDGPLAPSEAEAEVEDPEPELAGRLIGRHRIVRRLARGGMGTVYLAERADGAFERQVAIKLLRRGLDTDDILARFRAERQILAGLDHPHIARLLDGGASEDGRPYLVMEYVEGLPITAYCDQHRLDVDERLRLFGAVCEAVHYAHQHRVIHRDLKPSNILVDEQGRVKLLDFGIARLLAAGAERSRTLTGTRLMTPEYASPEQVRGEPVGVASDVYQLGMLLYELLCGMPPYRARGRSAEEVERVVCGGRITAPSERLRTTGAGEVGTEGVASQATARARRTDAGRLRRRLRGDLDTIVLTALRAEPARRYASVEALGQDVERHRRGLPVIARPDSPGYRARKFFTRHRAPALTAVGTALAVLVGFGLVTNLQTGPDYPPSNGGVAVLPFRVSGADASLGFLREGMVDLLATKLTGEGGPKALPPATVLASWRRNVESDADDLSRPSAIELARRLGAERLIVGEVVGTPSLMILNASLLGVPDGDLYARVTVRGPADSLPLLVDRLTGQLLIGGAGQRLGTMRRLSSASLPALQEYLEGLVAYRAARFKAAYERFSRALELDSTFALAAVRAYQAAWWLPRSGDGRVLELAWKQRDRLGETDRAFVVAAVGPNYPAPYNQRNRLAARRHLVELAPDWIDAQFMLADRIFHWHAEIELSEGRERAAARFRHILALDSTYAPTYQHLVPLLYTIGRTEEAVRLTEAYLRRQPNGPISASLRWRMAAARADTAALDRLRTAFGGLSAPELVRIYGIAVRDGVMIEDADRALQALRARALPPSTRRRVLREDYILQSVRGRPGAAARVAASLKRAQADEAGISRLEADNARVLSALYGDGDAEAAGLALESLTTSGFAPPAADSLPLARQLRDLCTVMQWRLWNGLFGGARAAIERLRRADVQGVLKATGPLCATLLEAILATKQRSSEAPARLGRLDSLLATGPHALGAELVRPGNLAAARLFEMQGNPRGALGAVRRRVYGMASANLLLAAALRLEGRLAAKVGDREGAIRAYRHYLALRSDPEPALEAQADSARVELRRLTGEP